MKGDFKMLKKDSKVTVLISKKKLKDFTDKCNEKEVTKSEILRRCIDNFLDKK